MAARSVDVNMLPRRGSFSARYSTTTGEAEGKVMRSLDRKHAIGAGVSGVELPVQEMHRLEMPAAIERKEFA